MAITMKMLLLVVLSCSWVETGYGDHAPIEKMIEQLNKLQYDMEEMKADKFSNELLLEKYQQLENKYHQLETNNNQLMDKYNELEREMRHTKVTRNSASTGVAFFAYVTETMRVQQGGLVFFDSIVTNYGDAYTDITGTFTAPLHGIYVFTLYIMENESVNTDLAILVNNEVKCKTFTGPDGYRTGTCTTVVELYAGDLVNVKQLWGEGSVYGAAYSGFSGTLYMAL